MKGRPWFSFGLVACATLVGLIPGLGALLAWVPGTGLWRLLTSQLAHWDANHLIWDALALGLLGGYAEVHWPRETRSGLLFALLLVPLVVVGCHPEMAFRGLSGLACTAATVIGCMSWREADGDRLSLLLGLGMLVGLLAKVAYELLSGDALFASAEGWRPLPVAHLAGIVAAWLAVAGLNQWAYYDR